MADTRTADRTQGAPMQDMRDEGVPANQQVAPRQGGPPMTAMQRAKAQQQQARAFMLDDVRAQRTVIEGFLKPLGVQWDFFISALISGFNQTAAQDPEFFGKVTPESFIGAVIKCAKDGLIPDGKEAAIGRFAENATYLPMVKGFVKIMWATGLIADINHNIVLEGDEFDFEEGSSPYVRHRPDLDADPNDPNNVPRAAYCFINVKGGGKLLEVTRRAELLKIAKLSKSEKGPRGVWQGQMHRKAPLRRIIGRLPPHPRLTQLLEHEDANYLPTPRAETAVERRVERSRAIADENLFTDDASPRDAQVDPPADDSVEQREPAEVKPKAKKATRAQVKTAKRQTAAEKRAAKAAPAEPEPESEQNEPRSPEEVCAAFLSRIAAAETPDDLDAAITDIEATVEFEALPGELQDRLIEAARVRFALRAIISSTTGERTYEDPALWVSDILTKMSAVTGEKLDAFWRANVRFVLAARTDHPEQAARVLSVATDKKLPMEAPRA